MGWQIGRYPSTLGSTPTDMATFFTDFFDIDPAVLDAYGAFNVSLVNDLPLFVDPFLLFNSEKQEYQQLHQAIITYLIFLRDSASNSSISDGLLRSWYCFPEVAQNWLGFSVSGNSGRGLGIDFARSLHSNLNLLFSDFGSEKITRGSHLEKVCLIREGVGRDNISDFTTNLIIEYLCEYTQSFAKMHLKEIHLRQTWINNARFNYATSSWVRERYLLPWINNDFVILTPKDILTRDETWINRGDLIRSLDQIPSAIPDASLRAQIENYFNSVLVRHRHKEPTQKERDHASALTLLKYPELIDYYIRRQEDRGAKASNVSAEKVLQTELMFIHQLRDVQKVLEAQTSFYSTGCNSYEEAHARLAYLKDVIENKGGHRIFYQDGVPLERESDLQILYRLVWCGTPSDVTREANDGRGPVDFKISRGASDKTLVEMKLAKNSKLERNLLKQVPIYQAASDAKRAIKAIIYFSESEYGKVLRVLRRLGIESHRDIVLIDARADNKPSGSKA